MKYFGTDGIRGKYSEAAVSEPFYAALGAAAAKLLSARGGGKMVVGGDTRASTPSLKRAFCAGFAGAGGEFEDMGVLPTPALAYAVLDRRAAMGAMITASHNPYTDNGIKFFDSAARKIDDDTQEALEVLLESGLSDSSLSGYVPEKFSPAKFSAGRFAMGEYVSKMASIFPANFLKGMRVALDAANGATSGVSAEVLRLYGAEVFETACSPDGFNINDGAGSQHPKNLLELCAKVGAHAGFAHDGDGDRVVVADDKFSILEGEEVLGLIAQDAAARGTLRGGGIVTTFQSNMGLDESLGKCGIKVWRCGIGDRLVAQMMGEKNCNIGGENSGHYIFSDVSPCGDGLASALSVLSVAVSKGAKLSELRGAIKMYPSESVALEVARKTPVEQTRNLSRAVAECERELGAAGRLLVRYSGTEKKIRLLVESREAALAAECMDKLKRAAELDLQ